MRCFLALPLAGEGLRCAQTLQERLRARLEPVRWVRPETLHVTLHFFGSVADEDAQRALAAVAPIAARTPSLPVRLDMLGTFPARGAPRVLWLGSREPHEHVGALAAHVREALAEAGFAVEPRPFTMHCTLGRPAGTWPAARRRAMLDGWNDASPTLCAFTASRIVLYESHPAAGGTVHDERAELPLAG